MGVEQELLVALALIPVGMMAVEKKVALGGHPACMTFLHRSACLFVSWRR